MKTLLVVLWLSVGGDYELHDGWYPRAQPDMATCLERAERVEAFINEHYKGEFYVRCISL